MRRFKLFAVTMFVGALAVSTAALLFSVSSASAQEAAWTVLPQPDRRRSETTPCNHYLALPSKAQTNDRPVQDQVEVVLV
jgi:hypothetical protein